MKLLVVFHVYYQDQIPWFIDKMRNIHGCEWDLVVTCSSLEQDSQALISSFKPDTRFITCENAGYDIWPFLDVLQQVSLDNYDLVMKLHTKSNFGDTVLRFNGIKMTGTLWRDLLVDAMLQDKARFEKVLNQFGKSSRTGMICSGKLFIAPQSYPEDKELLDNEMNRIGLQCKDHRFCAGTMMIFRASLLKNALPLGTYTASLFPSAASHSGATLAHVYERILSILVPAKGYKVYHTDTDLPFLLKFYLRKPIGALGLIFNLQRKDGVKYLTLFGLRFPLDK